MKRVTTFAASARKKHTHHAVVVFLNKQMSVGKMSTFEATRTRTNQGLRFKDSALTAAGSACQLGFWSAVLATLSSIGYGIACHK